MNILDAHVVDLRVEGRYVDPYIELKVDEFVMETAKAKYNPKLPDMRVIPCGPFMAVEEKMGRNGWTDIDVDLGKFNTSGFHREQLIGVHVQTPEETLELQMGVQRARRLLRKYEPDWQILPSEPAALQGRILWRVEHMKPECFECSLAPVQTVWYSGAHVPLCKTHLSKHTSRVRYDTLVARS